MRRLTTRNFNMCEGCPQGTTCEHYCDTTAPVCQNKAIYDRLADYEDTGMEPGEMYMPPCKVGDKVWVLEHRVGATPEILEENVMCLSDAGKGMMIMISYREYCSRPLAKNIGKDMGEGHLSVFLSPEEAEAALESVKSAQA